MPFSPTALIPLVQTPAFGLWHYRSADTRAQITAAGYFLAARTQLRPGDIIIAEAVDSLAFLPVRANAAIGTGLNLDGAVAPVALTRSIAQTLRIVQTATGVVSTIILAPLLAGVIAGSAIPVQAQIVGPVSQVLVSVRDEAGAPLPPVLSANVVQGYVTVNLPAPPVGTGYRIRMEDAGATGVVAETRTFNVLPDLRLVLTEGGHALVQEDGSVLAQN